jgi:hypothetical protein
MGLTSIFEFRSETDLMIENCIKVGLDSQYIGDLSVKMLYCGASTSLWRGSVSRMYKISLVNENDRTKVISSRLDRSFFGRVICINTKLANYGQMTTHLKLFRKSATVICGKDTGFSIETFLSLAQDEYDDIVFRRLVSDVDYSFEVVSKSADLAKLFGVAVTIIYSSVFDLSLG